MMKVSKTLITALQRLIEGDSVASSLLRNDMAETLLAEGLLTVKAQGSRKTFHAIDKEALLRFLESHYEEFRDVSDSSLVEKDQLTRSDQALSSGNSKLVKVRSCPGFPINSYKPINCLLHGQRVIIYPPEGSFMYIDDWRSFSVPEDVVLVGIENMENFRMIRKQRTLFESVLGDKPLLFISRYPQSTDLRQWLQTIPNRYIHFGDFDLAGINIFLTEFQKYLGDRASFLIPPDIEQRLSQGSSVRYNAQYSKFHTLHCSDKNLQSLVDVINKYHRCYDQEGYIAKNDIGKYYSSK